VWVYVHVFVCMSACAGVAYSVLWLCRLFSVCWRVGVLASGWVLLMEYACAHVRCMFIYGEQRVCTCVRGEERG